MCKNNYLVLGASSNVATEFILSFDKTKNNFYGLSTKPESRNSMFFNKVISYKDYHQYSDIEFSNILVIASRNPIQGGCLDDYLEVNSLVLNILNKIKYSQSNKSKITFLSSFSVFDKNLTYLSDSTPLIPSDYYGESKILLEEDLIDISTKFDADLLICRLPVFLYQGVDKASKNFLAKLLVAIKSKSRFTLTNPNSSLGAVFDVRNLANLNSANTHKLKVVNCSAEPDISFKQIAELAMLYGLEGVDWNLSDRPSIQICTKTLRSILGYEPSAKKIIEQWLAKELS